VLEAIRAVLRGEMAVSPKIALVVLRRFFQASPHSQGKGIEQLTDREFQVLQLLGAGMATRMIAVELKLSFKTIETHRENIKRKLGLADAPALVHFATNWLNRQSETRGASLEAALKA
jgi:DNA-binding NarL/FixJ family response regulator